MSFDSDDVSVVSPSVTLRGTGELRSNSGSAMVSAFILTRKDHDPTSVWEFELFPELAGSEPQHESPFSDVLRGGSPRLIGVSDRGVQLEVPDLRWRQSFTNRLVGRANEVILGPDSLGWKPASQYVRVEFSQTPLAVPERDLLYRSYTGELPAGEESDRYCPRRIPTSLGDMSFALHFDWVEASVGGAESVVRIPVPTLYKELSGEDTWLSPLDLAREVETATETFVRLLSFLSRQHVVWTRIKVTSMPGEIAGKGEYPQECQRIRATFLELANRESGMVNPYRMGKAGLATIVQNLESSHLKPSVLNAMLYTIIARGTRFVEPKMVNAFTALEALSSGFAKHEKCDKILGSAQFRRVQRDLRKNLKKACSEPGIEDASFEAMKQKLPELNRPSISALIVRLIKHYEVQWDDLWPPEADLPESVRKLYSVRSRFLHEGQTDDSLATGIAGQRALVLAERTVYRILGGDNDWLSPRGNGDWNVVEAEAFLMRESEDDED